TISSLSSVKTPGKLPSPATVKSRLRFWTYVITRSAPSTVFKKGGVARREQAVGQLVALLAPESNSSLPQPDPPNGWDNDRYEAPPLPPTSNRHHTCRYFPPY